MSKTTYWITNLNGLHAQVVGVEERDRWTPLGWSVVDEPKDTDFVYMRKEGIEQPAQFAYGAAQTWASMDWEFCAPPAPVDVTKDPQLFDQPPTTPAPEPKTTTKPATAAASKDKE